jgi:hypothetical protein
VGVVEFVHECIGKFIGVRFDKPNQPDGEHKFLLG